MNLLFNVAAQADGFAILRNSKALTTPVGNAFVLPTIALAEAIAEEWRAQKPKPDPLTMPIMQLAVTTLDVTFKQRAKIVEQVGGFAANDLLCQRADQPEELKQLQHKLWQPVLDWAAGRYDALMRVGEGIMPIPQPEEGMRALHRAVASFDDFTLTGVKYAAEVSHSLMLALALVENFLDAEKVFEAAECDTLFQMKQWGSDPAAVNRHDHIRRDLSVCEKFFNLLRQKN